MTGEKVVDYLNTRLFEPLHIDKPKWEESPQGINPGTRIEQAAERGMTKETSDWMQGYGYQMWRCRPGCFRADGARGQYIIVVPDKNAVIAIK